MRLADRGTMIAIVMLAAVAAFVLAAPALAAPPAGSQGLGPDGNPGQGHIKRTGIHGYNRRTSIRGDASIEVVEGSIAVNDGKSIGMDGETFVLGNAVVRDDNGRALSLNDLGVGYKVTLTLSNGVVRDMRVHDYQETGLITDPAVLREHERRARGRVENQHLEQR